MARLGALLWLAWMAGASFAHADDPAWTATWYLTDECGPGRQTRFIVPTEDGAVWVNSASSRAARLWRLGHGPPSTPFAIVATSGGEENAAILSAAIDKSGAVWVGTDSGLVRIAEGRTELHRTVSVANSILAVIALSVPCSAEDVSLLLATAQSLWAWGPGFGLLRTTKWGWSAFVGGPPHDPCPYTSRWLGRRAPTSLTAGPDGTVLLGTEDGELLLLRESPTPQGTDVGLIERFDAATMGTSGAVVDAMVASDGAIWVVTPDAVACRREGAWRTWRAGEEGLPACALTTVCEVRPGVVWVGLRWPDSYTGGQIFIVPDSAIAELGPSGWALLDGRPWAGVVTKECSRRVTRIRRDAVGRVWVGTHGGVACFEPTNAG